MKKKAHQESRLNMWRQRKTQRNLKQNLKEWKVQKAIQTWKKVKIWKRQVLCASAAVLSETYWHNWERTRCQENSRDSSFTTTQD